MQIKVAMVNLNGAKNKFVMKNLKKIIEKREVDLMFLLETFISPKKDQELREIFIDYDVYTNARKDQYQNANYKERGGIAAIARKGVTTEKKVESDDLIWLKVGSIEVGSAYFVPPSSPFVELNESRMAELQQLALEASGQVLIMTDANGWIGTLESTIQVGETEETYHRTSEKEEKNHQGEWFVSSMNSANLIILNGIKEKAKYTYDNPAREARSVIDYAVVNKKALTSCGGLQYWDYRGKLDNDHVVLALEMKLPTGIEQRTKRRKKKKKQPAMQQLRRLGKQENEFWFRLYYECDRSLRQLGRWEDINLQYKHLAEKLETAVRNAIPFAKSRSLQATLSKSEEIRQLRKRKKQVFEKIKSQEEETRQKAREELKLLNKELKKKNRQVIQTFKKERLEEIESLGKDDSRRMWWELKKLAGWSKREEAPEMVLNLNGEEVRGPQALEAWKTAFEQLGKENLEDNKFDKNFAEEAIQEEKEEPMREEVTPELDEEITLNEVKESIRKLKNGKAPGPDDVVAEVLKHGGDQVELAVWDLCQRTWRDEKPPEAWTKGTIVPIYKDGERNDPMNYRGITLLSITGKVFTQILNERLTKWSESKGILAEEQCGFRPRRGCPDQLFALTETIRMRGRKGTFCCFIDVKKAFDRVFRAGLWKRLTEEGVTGKMLRVVKAIYDKVESRVAVNEETTTWFRIETGVRQGCILSPLLYAIFINGLVKATNAQNKGVTIDGGSKLGILLYADDIVLLAESRKDLQQMMDLVASYAKKWRFEINPKKSQVMVAGTKWAPRNIQWKMGGLHLEQTKSYKYLGLEITRTGSWSKHIKKVVGKARANL